MDKLVTGKSKEFKGVRTDLGGFIDELKQKYSVSSLESFLM